MLNDTDASSPLVSVALCTYNGARYLAEQLESIVAQTHRRLEIVVVDDASSDDTVAIASRFAAQDARIRIVRNETNLGFRANFERALGLCRGELIAPCDQDDVWETNKVARLLDALGERSLSYCDSTLVDGANTATGMRMSSIVPMLSTDDPAPFAFGNCVSGHAMLFRRELLASALPIPPEFFYDWWIAAVAASQAGIVYCAESLVRYRQHGDNVTARRLAEMQADAGLAAQPERAAPATGHKWQQWRDAERRLAALARLPGRHQPFILELSKRWRAREHQWLSLRLGMSMARNRRRLLRLTTLTERRARRFCRDCYWGLRMKRLTQARAFAPR